MSLGNAVTLQVRELLSGVAEELRATPFAPRLDALSARLDGPLRVAIAGRVKAGKSTLLNALVGERLAPTDAGECTKVVSWYEHGSGYKVSARLHSGSEQNLAFRRDGGSLGIELGGLLERDIASIRVAWPANSLTAMSLIDTPGLASINDENSRRTREFLEADTDRTSDADAVVYLMRHMHRTDMQFLDAFMDRSVSAASPVNAVAVLSRADEIGAGRLDAMDSARRIADRYRSDPAVQSLAATVVPVAGLLAETALTLREDEVASLRTVHATEAELLERMLLSAEGFCDPHSSAVTVEIRRDLLERFGMFGLRIAMGEIGAGVATAAAMAPKLIEHSGLESLRSVINAQFLPRARLLQARAALVSVRLLVPELQAAHPATADRLAREAERIEASAIDFARLRAAHLLSVMAFRIPDQETHDLERLLLGPTDAAALGLDPDVSRAQLMQHALDSIARWRERAADPLAAPGLVEVFETASRTCEGIYASTTA